MIDTPDIEHSTEERIKEAARIVFQRKGFSATRTRDIAEAAGINLALLNYYFRSKQKLFDLIIMESFQEFVETIKIVVNNSETSFIEKAEEMAGRYIDLFTAQPDIPMFILTEMRNNPEEIFNRLNLHNVLNESFMFRQLNELILEKNITINPLHFVMNFIGMILFPFVASPLIRNIGNYSDAEYNELMQQRKQLVPQWVKLILNNPIQLQTINNQQQ